MIDGRGSHSWEQNEGEGGNCRVHRGSVFGSHTRTYKKAAPVIGRFAGTGAAVGEKIYAYSVFFLLGIDISHKKGERG